MLESQQRSRLHQPYQRDDSLYPMLHWLTVDQPGAWCPSHCMHDSTAFLYQPSLSVLSFALYVVCLGLAPQGLLKVLVCLGFSRIMQRELG
jgi:hypothetical protein